MIRKLAATALVALVLPLVATASASAPVTVLLKEDTTSYVAALSYSTPVEFDDNYDHIPLSYSTIGFKVVSTKVGQPVKIRWTLSCEGKGGFLERAQRHVRGQDLGHGVAHGQPRRRLHRQGHRAPCARQPRPHDRDRAQSLTPQLSSRRDGPLRRVVLVLASGCSAVDALDQRRGRALEIQSRAFCTAERREAGERSPTACHAVVRGEQRAATAPRQAARCSSS